MTATVTPHRATSAAAGPVFDAALISRYDVPGPRYTSYPTALQFHEGFTPAQYLDEVGGGRSRDQAPPLSLYVHIPFCATVCFYCACTKIITANRAHAEGYLHSLHREIEAQGRAFGRGRVVEQLHWGGGTPTFLDAGQMRRLMDQLRRHFTLREDDGGEYSIEIDPRSVDAAGIAHLRELGFNRMSLGVQDFDTRVQQAVNRLQSRERTLEAMESARRHGFHSVNVDLIYGLPHQSVASFTRTLDQVVELEPDRLAIFNYAHLPARFKTQRQIRSEDLPSAAEKLDILHTTIDHLTARGYLYIGMDHFARPGDALARAQAAGTLSRNFQGYTTHGECDLIGMGVSAIGRVGDCYAQNARDPESYAAAVESQDGLPVTRGVRLDADDRLRRDVINALICNFRLDTREVEARHGIVFETCFAPELERLQAMQADGLVSVEPGRILIEPPGRLLVRNVCMSFDRYLRQNPATPAYSRAI